MWEPIQSADFGFLLFPHLFVCSDSASILNSLVELMVILVLFFLVVVMRKCKYNNKNNKTGNTMSAMGQAVTIGYVSHQRKSLSPDFHVRTLRLRDENWLATGVQTLTLQESTSNVLTQCGFKS